MADLSVQRFDRLKRNLRNFAVRADKGVNAPTYGRIFFSCVVQGFLRASLETRKKIAPSFFFC